MSDDGITQEFNGLRFKIISWSRSVRFRARYGRPNPNDADATEVWNDTQLPSSQPLRREATIYLHAEFGGICPLCELPIDIELPIGHPARAQLDHVLPSSRGGLDIWGNVRVVHGSCNSERGNDSLPLFVDWARELLDAVTRCYLKELTEANLARVRGANAERMLAKIDAEIAQELEWPVPDYEGVEKLEMRRREYALHAEYWPRRARQIEDIEAGRI